MWSGTIYKIPLIWEFFFGRLFSRAATIYTTEPLCDTTLSDTMKVFDLGIHYRCNCCSLHPRSKQQLFIFQELSHEVVIPSHIHLSHGQFDISMTHSTLSSFTYFGFRPYPDVLKKFTIRWSGGFQSHVSEVR